MALVFITGQETMCGNMLSAGQESTLYYLQSVTGRETIVEWMASFTSSRLLIYKGLLWYTICKTTGRKQSRKLLCSGWWTEKRSGNDEKHFGGMDINPLAVEGIYDLNWWLRIMYMKKSGYLWIVDFLVKTEKTVC